MRARYLPVFLLLFAVAAQEAAASPIQAYGGWLDGTLRAYDGFKTINGTVFLYPNVLRREYVLGVDFFPAVPRYYTDSGLLTACVWIRTIP